MYTISCHDMGMMDCAFVAEGSTPEEAMAASKAHGMSAHAEKMAEMMKTMSEEQMMDAMKNAVKSA